MQSALHSFHGLMFASFELQLCVWAPTSLESTAIVLAENIGFESLLSLPHFQQFVTTLSQDAAKVERTAVFLFFNCSTSAFDSVDEARFRSR